MARARRSILTVKDFAILASLRLVDGHQLESTQSADLVQLARDIQVVALMAEIDKHLLKLERENRQD